MKTVKINWIVLGFGVVYPFIAYMFGKEAWTVAKVLSTIEWACIAIFAYSFLSSEKNIVTIKKRVQGERVTVEFITVPILTYTVQVSAIVTYLFQRKFFVDHREAISDLTMTVLLMLIVYVTVEKEGRPWRTKRRKITAVAEK